MTSSFQSIFSFLSALCAAASVHSLLSWLFSRPPSIARSLQDYTHSSSSTYETDAPFGSALYKIRLAFAGFGLNVSGREQFWLYVTIGIFSVGLVIGAAVFGLPPLFWLGGPAIAYFTGH